MEYDNTNRGSLFKNDRKDDAEKNDGNHHHHKAPNPDF